jgi:rhamnosyltransferase
LDEDTTFGSATSNFLSAVIKAPVGHFDYVCFCDQDDIWLPQKLIRAVGLIRENNVGGYSSNCISWHHGSCRYDLIKKNYPQTPFDHMFQGPGPGCSMVMRASDALLLVDFLKGMTDLERSRIWWHDWFTYAFFGANKLGWYIDSYASLLYRQHEANVIGANVGL